MDMIVGVVYCTVVDNNKLHSQYKSVLLWLWLLFLDQELILYHYWSCCCSCSSWCLSLQKSLRLRCFLLDRNEIWQHCSSSKYALIDGAGFSIWCLTFKMAAMTSFCHKSAATWWVNMKCLPALLQQRPPVPDLYYICTCWYLIGDFVVILFCSMW